MYRPSNILYSYSSPSLWNITQPINARRFETCVRGKAIREQCEKLQQAVNADTKKDTTIQEKKKLLGGVRYCIMGREFSSETEAKALQAELLSQVAVNQQALDNTTQELQKMEQELENLDK